MGGLQFSFSISVLHTTTVAISNIFFCSRLTPGLICRILAFHIPTFPFLNPHQTAGKPSPSLQLLRYLYINCERIWSYFTREAAREAEEKCESSRCHLKNTSSFTWMQTQVPQRIPFIPREAGTARACPANSPSRYLCSLAWPGAALTRPEPPQWTTRGRKYSQKQLAKALAQPTPCLYLLRGLDSVQILERKKNRKCFTCYLIWSSCSEQLLVPGEPCGSGQVPREGSAAAAGGCVGPGRAHLQFPRDFTQHELSLQQNIPISAVSPVLSHTQGRQIELVSISKSWRNNLHISKLWNLLPEDLLRTLKHLPDI